MFRNPLARVLVALIVVGLLAAAGWRLYDIGYDHGVTDGVAKAATSSTVVVHDDYGHRGGFFPFFLFFPFGFFILFFFILRPLAWGRRWGNREGMRRNLEAWHREQHEKENESR